MAEVPAPDFTIPLPIPAPARRSLTEAPDPGTPRAAFIAWILTVLLLSAVVFMNQCEKPAAAKTTAPIASGSTPPKLVDPLALYGKIMVKLAHSGMVADDKERIQLVEAIDGAAETPEGRLRASLVAAEILGPQAGLDRLKSLEESEVLNPRLGEKPTHEVPETVRLQIPFFKRVLEGDSPQLEAAEQEKFLSEHGWFAKLALSRGLSDTDPRRAGMIAGGWRLIAVIVAAICLLAVAFVGGLACFITGIAMASTGKLRPAFICPARGGSVYLELVAVFIAGFLLFMVGLDFFIGSFGSVPPEWSVKLHLILQWVLLALVFWPLVRGGLSFGEFRRRLGWHGGRGVLREIGSGLFGYFACLPLLAVAMLITVVIVLVRAAMQQSQGVDPSPPDNPIIELVSNASTLELVMIFILATCWAPLVEEAVFRGAFFRHLRSHVGVLAAAAISAVAFGVMHGYELLMLLPVMTLGFGFALMREWRGSVIACMTAHFVHNATVLSFLYAFLSILRD